MASDNNNNNNSGSSYLSPKDQPKRYNIEAIERKDRYKEKRTAAVPQIDYVINLEKGANGLVI